MERKVLAAVLSNRNWDDLTRKLAFFESVEMLSPLHNMEDLERTSVRGLLDVVFIDVEEFLVMSPNGKLDAMGSRGLYVVIVADRMNPEEMRIAMRSGAKDYLIRPFNGEDLSEVFQRALAHKPSPPPSVAPEQEKRKKKHAEIITFFTTKGGAGKSTLATNLALALSRNCKCSVCLLDLSLQFGDLSLMLDSKPPATIIDVVNSGGVTDEDIRSFLVQYDGDVHLLASPAKPEEAELVHASHINNILDALSTQFDYIIIDTAASFSDVSLAALDRSNKVFLLVTPVILGVKNLIGTLDVMRKSLMYPEEKMKVILNRSDSKSGISPGDIEKLIKKKIDYMVPSDGNVVVPAVNRGIPAVVGCPRSKFSKAVVEISEDIAGIRNTRPAGPGFLDRLLKRVKKESGR